MPLSREADAARKRAQWAAMSTAEKTAYYGRKRLMPSQQGSVRHLKRMDEYRKKLGPAWTPVRERPFVGVDGEGGEWEGRHSYGMLTVGENTLQHEDGSPLTSAECLDFLTAQPKDKRYVIYFGGYDATFFFRDFPAEVQKAILEGKQNASGKRVPVWWQNWGIDYIPRKILKLYRSRFHPDGPGSITLYDVSAYWQCSFVKALEDWQVGTEEERSLIKKGKEARQQFTLEEMVWQRNSCVNHAAVQGLSRKPLASVPPATTATEGLTRTVEGRKTTDGVKVGATSVERLRDASSTTTTPQAVSEASSANPVTKASVSSETTSSLSSAPCTICYNLLETRLLSELVTRMVEAAEGLGITLRSYHGPATLSEAFFEKNGLGRYTEERGNLPGEVQDWVRHAYFGGRFECSAVGIAEAVYEYDICSAYPAAMTTLPCQACGEWTDEDVPGAQSKLHWVAWDCQASTARFMPFPWRDVAGSLCYPKVGTGFYWGEEVAAAQRHFPGMVRVLRTWSYRTTCRHEPLEWMGELYAERKRLGKGTAGRVLKLAMNSAYGVFARTIGGGGRWANYWWAGQITARTRAKLLDLAMVAGEDCLMLATDGLYARRPLDIPTGMQLGDWEDGGQVGPMLLVQPGVYFSLDGQKARTRGVSLKAIKATGAVERMVEAWKEDGPEAVVPVNLNFLMGGEDEPRVFIGTKLALAWGKPQLIGSWQPLDKSLSFRPEPRRVRADWEGELLRTYPPLHPHAAMGVWSAPYEKMPARQAMTEAVRYVQPELF